MPKLKQITCSVELGLSRTKLKEYGARYSDGVVETFIAVPDTTVPFCLHLQTEGYISPGLAVFVFMDGKYQCNRNRLGAHLPGDGVPPSKYEWEFCLRQKEEKTAEGRFVGREWTFTKLDIGTADNAASLNPNFMQNVGTIEVVILRVSGKGKQVPTPDANSDKPVREVSQSRSTKASVRHSRAPSAAPSSKAKSASDAFGGMFGLFDGTGDEPELSSPPKKLRKDRHISISTKPAQHEAMSIGLDGANDPAPFKPVGKGGFINDDNRSVLTWDDCAAQMIPRYATDHSTSHYVRKAQEAQEKAAQKHNYLATGENRDDRTDVHNPGARGAQLDGHGDGPQVIVNNYGKDDMEGDKYLGAKGDDRHMQKGRLRDQGVAVSPMTVLAGQAPEVAQGNRLVPDPVEQYQFAQKGYQSVYEAPRQQYQPQLAQDQPAYQAPAQPVGQVHPSQVPRMLENMQSQITLLKQETARVYEMAATTPAAMSDKAQRLGELMMQEQQLVSNRNSLQQDYERLVQMERMGQANALGQQQAGQFQAYPQAQAQAVPQGRIDGWAQVGEGVVGGGASLNKDWAMPQRDQKPSSHAGAKTRHRKHESTNAQWGSGQQNGNQWDDNKSQKSSLQKTPSHDGDGWAGGGSQKGSQKQEGWGASGGWKAESKKDDGGWGDSGGQANQDAGWGNQDDAAQAAGHGWGDGGDADKTKNDRNGGGQQNQSSGADNQGWGAGGSQRAASAAASLAGNFDTMSVSSNAQAKPYWADWRQSSERHESADPNTKRKREEARSVYNYPASPLPAVPADKVHGATHGVKAGKGADYSHRCHRPVYIDEMGKPYAVFSFKYRSKGALEKILKRSIDADIEPIVQQAEKDKLMNMPKQKLIEELMNARNPQGASKSAPAKAVSAAGWGADASNSGRSNKDGGWGGQSNHGGKSEAGGNNNWDAQGQKNASKKSSSQAGGWGNEKSGSNENAAGGWGAPASNHNGGGGWDNSTPAAAGGWDGGNDARSDAGGRHGGDKAKSTPRNKIDLPSHAKTKKNVKKDEKAVPQMYEAPKMGFGAWNGTIPKVKIGGGSVASGFDRGDDAGGATPVHGFSGFPDTLGSGAGGQYVPMAGHGGFGGMPAMGGAAMDPKAMYGRVDHGKTGGGALPNAQDLANPMAKYAAGGAAAGGQSAW